MTRTAAAFTAALCIHILLLRTNPGWRLAGMPWCKNEPAGITVRIASIPRVIDQGNLSTGPESADAADSRTKREPRPESSPISAISWQREVVESPAVIMPLQIKRTPDVLAPEAAADRPALQRLEAVDGPPAVSGSLTEKITDPRQENVADSGQRNSREVRESPAIGRSPANPADRTAIPLYKKNPPPAYPGLARKRGYEGTTILRVLVNETGSVDTVLVATSSGYELLDTAALQAVAGWSFAPATSNGRPVTVWVMVPVRFALQ